MGWISVRGGRVGRTRLVGLLVVGLLGVGCSAGGGDREASGSDAGARLLSMREVVRSLQDERLVASMEAMGMANALELPVGNNAEARRFTDGAVESLRAEGVDQPAPVRSGYRAALDALSDVATVRADLDTYQGPGTLDSSDLALDIFDHYSAIIDAVIDSQSAVARSIENPSLRTGGELLAVGLEQVELEAQLGIRLLVGRVDPSDSAWAANIPALYDEALQGQETVEGLASNTAYEGAVSQLVDELETAPYLNFASTVIEGGQPDIAQILDAATVPADQGWSAFLNRVEASLMDQY
jgi:Nitrate and nitrite sensing